MTGRSALVVGATSGLGHYLATCLAADGWSVTGVGRRARVSSERLTFHQADLVEHDAVPRLLAAVGVDYQLVIQNAVKYPPREASSSALEDVFRVNALVPYALTQSLLAAQPFDDTCLTVMINSDAMFHADESSAAYAASKAALRVLTAALASSCRSRGSSVATLLLGPLADDRKTGELRQLAERRGVSTEEMVKVFLRRSNPELVIEHFIDFPACWRSIVYMLELGPVANGMLCRVDGGSAGSLI